MTSSINGFDVLQFIIPRAENWKVRYALSTAVDDLRELFEEGEIDQDLASSLVTGILDSLVYSVILTQEEADAAERLEKPITEEEIKAMTEHLGIDIEKPEEK